MPPHGPIRIAVLDADGEQSDFDLLRSISLEDGVEPREFAIVPGNLDRLRTTGGPDIILIDVDGERSAWTNVVAQTSADLGCDVVALVERPEAALLAFEVGCADCLLKPPRPERLRLALTRAMNLREARSALAARTRPSPWRIELPNRDGGTSISVGDVVRIEAARDYALIHSSSRVHIVRATMTELERALPRPVVRVHRSAMVSLAFVRGWGPPGRGQRKLVLSDGARVPVGPTYVASTKLALREWLDGGARID